MNKVDNLSVLITDKPDNLNKYNQILASEVMKATDFEIVRNRALFWTDEAEKFSLIHVQWPEHLLSEYSRKEVSRLLERIRTLKGKGIKFILTHHNSTPHHGTPEFGLHLYEGVYGEMDAIIHLAQHSVDNFSFPVSKEIAQFVVPHPCYPVLNAGLTQAEARKELGFAADTVVYLVNGVILVMPRWMYKKEYDRGWKSMANLTGYALGKVGNLFQKDMLLGIGKISEQDSELYFRAADALIIPRESLNSGNLYQGLSYGLSIICANFGNTGALAKSTGNILYEYGNVDQLAEAMALAGKQKSGDIGRANSRLAQTTFSPSVVGLRLAEVYRSTI